MSAPKRRLANSSARSELTALAAFERYRRFRPSFYYAYNHRDPHTNKLLNSGGDYGVVQLRCIDNEVRAGFLAGYRAAKRHAQLKAAHKRRGK